VVTLGSTAATCRPTQFPCHQSVKEIQMQATTNLQYAPRGVEPEVAGGNPAIGAMFLSFFGTIWLMLGCLCNSTRYDLAAIVSGAIGLGIFSAALVAAARLRKQRPAKAEPTLAELRRDRTFNRINIVQWVVCGLSALALNLTGHPEWIMASIILVVGLHFFPLAKLFQRPSHHVMGTILVFIALVLPHFVQGGPQSMTLPLSTGCVLLAFAVLGLYQARLEVRG
jgi:hypothetical protein